MSKNLFCILFLGLSFVSQTAFAGGKLINEELALPKNQEHESCPVDYRIDEKSTIARSSLTRRYIVEFLTFRVGKKIRQACGKLGKPPKGIRHVELVCGTIALENCTDKVEPGAFTLNLKGDTLLIQGKYESCTCANMASSIGPALDEIFK